MSRRQGSPQPKSIYVQLRDRKFLESHIQCQICGRYYQFVNAPHLHTHGITTAEYKARYQVERVISDEIRLDRARQKTRTDDHDVIRFIRRRHAEGKSFYMSDVEAENKAIYSAAEYCFGSWAMAIAAAGFEYHPGKPREIQYAYPTPEAVVRRLQERHQQGLSLRKSIVNRDDYGLAASIQHCFKRWDRAMRAAGFDPEDFKGSPAQWTKEKVILVIQNAYRQGRRLNATKMNHGKLIYAAKRLFGGWVQAVDAAGIDMSRARISGRRKWTPQEVLEAIRERAKTGKDMNLKAVRAEDLSLFHAGENYYGSWVQALQTAGLDPDQNRLRQRWTEEKILETIRQYFDPRAYRMRPGSPVTKSSLSCAACRTFGSWAVALKAAGLSLPEIS